MERAFDFSKMGLDKETTPSPKAESSGQYQERYPEDIEGLTALSDMPSYLRTHQALKRFRGEQRPETGEQIKQVAEYQFLLTDFLIKNGQDKKRLQMFWHEAESLADREDYGIDFEKLRLGVLSQATAYKIFEKLNLHPRLSHPSQDMVAAIDMWIAGDRAVQVKSSHERDVIVQNTEETHFPEAVGDEEDNVIPIDTYLNREMSKFKKGVRRFAASIHKSITGYLILIPRHEFNPVTAEPSAKIVRQVAEKLGVSLDRLESQPSNTKETTVVPFDIASQPIKPRSIDRRGFLRRRKGR